MGSRGCYQCILRNDVDMYINRTLFNVDIVHPILDPTAELYDKHVFLVVIKKSWEYSWLVPFLMGEYNSDSLVIGSKDQASLFRRLRQQHIEVVGSS